MNNNDKNPSWWNEKHSHAWERVKEAFSRDWEQTKADFSKTKGRELNQNVADTVKQAAGTQSPPPADLPNVKPLQDYHDAEPAIRYGHGAASQYADTKDWNPGLESKLKQEWDDLQSGRDWESMKHYVRHGWNKARHPNS